MGLWSGLKKSVKTVGGGVWGAVKYGGKTVKGVVDAGVGVVKSVGGAAEKVATKAGDAAGSAFSFLKILPWVGLAVAGIIVYFLFFKGGVSTVAGAVS